MEPVRLTPPNNLAPIDESGEMPYFESFSYHGPGSRSSLGSFLSTSTASAAMHH